VLCSSLILIVISGSGFLKIIISLKVLEIKEPSVSVLKKVLEFKKPLVAVFLKIFSFKRTSSKEIGSFHERIGGSLIY
jgi:hypothetical protein